MGVGVLMSRYRSSNDPLLTERRIELVAVILTVIFILQLFYGVIRLFISVQPESVLPAPDTLVVSELKRYGVVLDEHSAELRARPLFWASRRSSGDSVGQVAAVTKSKANKSELDKIKLLGIFGVGDSAGIIALVQGDKKRILLGDKMVGWTLESISGGHAVFTNGGRSQNVILARSNNPVAPPTKPAAPATSAIPAPIITSAGLSFGADPSITKK